MHNLEKSNNYYQYSKKKNNFNIQMINFTNLTISIIYGLFKFTFPY